MAISILDKTNTDGADSEYPFGNIRDQSGTTDGTPVNVEVYGDFHQFFAKMFSESGLTYNNLPDNEYNGWQFWEALEYHLNNTAYSTWTTPVIGGGFSTDPSSPIRYRKMGRTIRLKGTTYDTTPNSITTDVTLFTLPTGYRPAEDQMFITAEDSSNQFAIIQILTNGEVHIRGDIKTVSSSSIWMNITFDND